MATITVDATKVRRVEVIEQFTSPLSSTTTAGQLAAIDPTTGYSALADSNVHSAAAGIFEHGDVANMPVTVIRKGIVYIGDDALDALNFGDPVYMSTTAGALETVAPGVEEIQSVDITGIPTGGDFTLGFRGDETAAIAYDADAAAVQAALEALSTVGTGNVVVTGSNPNFAVKFVGELSGDVPLLTLEDNSLTGGTAPSVAVTVDVAGASVIPVATVVPLYQDNATGFSLGTPAKALRFDL